MQNSAVTHKEKCTAEKKEIDITNLPFSPNRKKLEKSSNEHHREATVLATKVV